jgi:hypothetical protein
MKKRGGSSTFVKLWLSRDRCCMQIAPFSHGNRARMNFVTDFIGLSLPFDSGTPQGERVWSC